MTGKSIMYRQFKVWSQRHSKRIFVRLSFLHLYAQQKKRRKWDTLWDIQEFFGQRYTSWSGPFAAFLRRVLKKPSKIPKILGVLRLPVVGVYREIPKIVQKNTPQEVLGSHAKAKALAFERNYEAPFRNAICW